MTMNGRERVLVALSGQEPDRVPRCELAIDPGLAHQLVNLDDWNGQDIRHRTACLEMNLYSVEEAKRIASFLHLDNISYVLRAPVYAHHRIGTDGRSFYGEGMIKNEADLAIIQLPDPYDDALYAEAEAFARQKEDFSAWFITRIGIFPTMLSMGLGGFGLALYDNPTLVETVLDIYCDWTAVVAERACQLGFDVFASTDDMAHKSAPFFSPSVFRDLVMPRYERVAEKIKLPWVVHTDGNVLPFVEYFIRLGVTGLHPIEKGAMDIRAMKRDYGDRLCLLGNVDLNILGLGTPEDVDAEVRELIRDVGPGGGYIVTSGNSLASYVRPENAIALSEAVTKYGRYPLTV